MYVYDCGYYAIRFYNNYTSCFNRLYDGVVSKRRFESAICLKRTYTHTICLFISMSLRRLRDRVKVAVFLLSVCIDAHRSFYLSTSCIWTVFRPEDCEAGKFEIGP